MPEILLSVVGRKSGILRSTPLLCVPHERRLAGRRLQLGRPAPPAWVGNLLAADERWSPTTGAPSPSTPPALGAERDEMWALMLETWPNYATYAERTGREIPVFWLTPT